ncbi:DEKNAAC101606 [Brettanomyces naardenensis]|uniref:DEKNAAC101606 n=1 Tax=Brettanomyces naardenensis TaxID=13370 RepID=A0A448YIF3_BRENA|nr:DEKNAAC101606 [Brettanomyces naardenensis]
MVVLTSHEQVTPTAFPERLPEHHDSEKINREPRLTVEELRAELEKLGDRSDDEADEDTGNPLHGTILDNEKKTNPNKAPLPEGYVGGMTEDYRPYEQYRVVKKTYGNSLKIPRATLFTLVRNEELYDILVSIERLENRFNGKMNYDWIFMNDKPFSTEFIELTSSMVSGTARYGIVPYEHWSYPEWIDQNKAQAVRESVKFSRVLYGSSESYRHMCRYNSKFFYHHPIMDDYDLYWRVEPNVDFMCDILEDPFRYMADTGTQYGFTIAFQEFYTTVETLWKTSMVYFGNSTIKEQLPTRNLLDFISDDNGRSYNMCHFWSNFEIANLTLWRDPMYENFVDHLDHAGGFFYERWGDAPVHSIGASMILRPEQVHVFGNIAYKHTVAGTCPLDDDLFKRARCTCNPRGDWTISSVQHCNLKFLRASKQQKMKDFNKYFNILRQVKLKKNEGKKRNTMQGHKATGSSLIVTKQTNRVHPQNLVGEGAGGGLIV